MIKKERLLTALTYQPLASTKEQRLAYLTNILTHLSPQWELDDGFTTGDVFLDRQLLAFLKALARFDEVYGGAITILHRCFTEGPEFAKECKDSRVLGFFIHCRAEEGDFIVDHEPSMKGTCYDSFFHESNLIFWEHPDPMDIEYMSVPVTENPVAIAEFREAAKFLLKDTPAPSKSRNFITKLSYSQSFNWDEMRSQPQFVTVLNTPNLEPSFSLRGRRCIIPVGPANYRDSVVLSPDSLLSVMILNDLYGQILDNFPEAVLCNDSSLKEHRLHELRSKNGVHGRYYYVRDFKKCGLTFNPTLLRIVNQILVEKFPDLGFEYGCCFDDIQITGVPDSLPQQDGIFRPRRGYILGMAQMQVTLCQVIIHFMNQSEADSESETKGFFYHDDTVIEGTLDSLSLYRAVDRKRCEDLGLQLKLETTGLLRQAWVFLEEYQSWESLDYWATSKNLTLACSLYKVLSVANIVQAKEIVNSYPVEYLEIPEVKRTVEDIISYFGYEFFPGESDLPYNFGGWMTPTFMEHDESLITVQDISPTILSKLLNAVEAGIRFEPRSNRSKYKIPQERYGHSSFPYLVLGPIDVEIHAVNSALIAFDRRKLFYSMQANMYKQSNIGQYYTSLWKARQRAYKTRVEPPFFYDICNRYIASYPRSYIAIPPEFLKDYYYHISTKLKRTLVPNFVDYNLDTDTLLYLYLSTKTDNLVPLGDEWSEYFYPTLNTLIGDGKIVKFPEEPVEVLRDLDEWFTNSDLFKWRSNFDLTFVYYYSKYGAFPQRVDLLDLVADNFDVKPFRWGRLEFKPGRYIGSDIYKGLEYISEFCTQFNLTPTEYKRILQVWNDIWREPLYVEPTDKPPPEELEDPALLEEMRLSIQPDWLTAELQAIGESAVVRLHLLGDVDDRANPAEDVTQLLFGEDGEDCFVGFDEGELGMFGD